MPSPSCSPRATCYCGLPPNIAVSRSAKNPGRHFANCPRFPGPCCNYFTWLDGWQPPSAVPGVPCPPTPGRCEGATSRPAAASPPSTTSPAASVALAPVADAAIEGSERFAALLVVCSDATAPQLLLPDGIAARPSMELVRLVLLPASAHPAPYCTQHQARQGEPGHLPRAPASLASLQPPYVRVRHCPAVRDLAALLGWGGRGGAFVLDVETTGLANRDFIHQLAVLNVASGQMLTALLRTCPRRTGSAAAKICGSNNVALHDPHRPTFGQLAPLLHAFMGASAGTAGGDPSPRLVIAHNGGFDARMLIGEWTRRGLPLPLDWRLLDTLPLARACRLDGCADSKQGTLRLHFGVPLPPGEAEHDAGTDVVVLAQLLPHLVRASGAATLTALAEGHVRGAGGKSFVRSFGNVRAGMRGDTAGGGEAVAFTCDVCHARVVQ